MRDQMQESFDVLVAGGGISGICAAIAAARHGARTALVHDRAVLGGNASSEIRMHICGADHHMSRAHARETGIVEELLLRHKYRNPENSYAIFDTILWEACAFQENLTLYLNTYVYRARAAEGRIQSVSALQTTTEKEYTFQAKIYIDATGDGSLGARAGADFAVGREAASVYGEAHGRDQSDRCTMGNSILFQACDRGRPVPFIKPAWAYSFSEEDLLCREHREVTSGYWWIELGGGEQDTIRDGEEIRDELIKTVYGVWDHIKNGGDHGAENLELMWMGMLPGKRESRRLLGDYVLTEEDCLSGARFDDVVAYGGWPLDLHTVEGFLRRDAPPNENLYTKDVYAIPYRCLYSRNVENLMLAGRAISCSHLAFASTRVMATCGVAGQAVGTAAALAAAQNLSPRQMQEHMTSLQQALLKDDCYLPGLARQDPEDCAPLAAAKASAWEAECPPENVLRGPARQVGEECNCWRAPGGAGQWISLHWKQPVAVQEIRIVFDSNLSREIMISLSDQVLSRQEKHPPSELARAYTLALLKEGAIVWEKRVRENDQRLNALVLDAAVLCDQLRLTVEATYGAPCTTVYEIRVY